MESQVPADKEDALFSSTKKAARPPPGLAAVESLDVAGKPPTTKPGQTKSDTGFGSVIQTAAANSRAVTEEAQGDIVPPMPEKPVELKGNPGLKLDAVASAWVDHHGSKGAQVAVQYGAVAKKGDATIKSLGDGTYSLTRSDLELSHPLFSGLADRLGGLAPILRAETKDGVVAGEIRLGDQEVFRKIQQAPALFGLPSLNIPELGPSTNGLIEGKLTASAELSLSYGEVATGTFYIGVSDEGVERLEADLSAEITGLASGQVHLERDATGAMSGTGSAEVSLPKGFGGKVELTFDGASISGQGTISYSGENFSGQVTIVVMPKAEAIAASESASSGAEAAPSQEEDPSTGGGGEKSAAPPDALAVFGSGELDFALDDWLTGRAQVAVDHRGYITVTGGLTPPAELVLFQQKTWRRELLKVEFRVAYGIPVVGNLFVFVNLGLSAFASLGPAKLYDILIEGTYSTDPDKARELSIAASLNLSAAAGITLAGQIGAGIRILKHDLKAGGELSATAALEAYTEARPRIGYRKPTGEPDSKGEFFIEGDLEAAVRPILRLGGKLFVEVDSPWWSPLPDKIWDWPLGSLEYPLPGEIALGAHLSYVFGSGEPPAIEPKAVEFDANKFMTDVLEDRVGDGADSQKILAEWMDQADSEKGGTQATGSTPTSTGGVQASSDSGSALPAEAEKGAVTADGQSVKDLMDKASDNPEQAKSEDDPLGTDSHSSDSASRSSVDEAIATLHSITRRLERPEGVTEEEVQAALDASKESLRGFKTLRIIRGDGDWDFEYTASPKVVVDGPKAMSRKSTLNKAIDDLLKEQDAHKRYKLYLAGDPPYIARKNKQSGAPRLYLNDDVVSLEPGPNQKRISTPGALPKNLEAKPDSGGNYQAHHIIPDEVVRKHELFAAAREWFDIDRSSNGIWLPSNEEAYEHALLPLHNGPHGTYNSNVKRLASELFAASEKPLAKDDAMRSIAVLETRLRNSIIEYGSNSKALGPPKINDALS